MMNNTSTVARQHSGWEKPHGVMRFKLRCTWQQPRRPPRDEQQKNGGRERSRDRGALRQRA